MRIVREIEAGRVACAPVGVDPEGPDLPVAGNRAHQEENHDQAGEEEEESKLSPPATIGFAAGAWSGDDRRGGNDGDRRAVGDQGDHGFHRGADRGSREDGFRRHRRSSGDGVRYGECRLGRHGCDRRIRVGRGPGACQFLQLCPGGADWRRYHRESRDGVLNRRRRQPSKPLLQLCPVRWILWLGSTPRWEAHLQPTLTPPDYGAYFARGGSTMPL